jgi:hypothetical protein
VGRRPARGRCMLFFFELFLFVLVMLTLALGEFISRWLALVLWLVVTVFSLVGYVLVRQALGGILAGESAGPVPPASAGGASDEPASHASLAAPASEPAPTTPLDEKWARTLLYNWRRSNILLALGAVAVGVWYWLAG